MNKILKSNIIFFSFSFFSLVLLYHSNLFNPNIPTLDQEVVISPLMEINSISEYIDAYKSYKIYDVQPIRDLSHFIDISLYKKYGVSFGIFHNLILIFISSIFLFNLFKKYFNDFYLKLIILIFLFHPILVSIVYLETSRKHILSFLFMLITLNLFYKFDHFKIKGKALTFFMYFLSIFSQPINLFSPFFYFFISSKDKKKKILNLLPFVFLMIICGVLNLYYYDHIFTLQSGIPKQLTSDQINIADNRLLSIGRMFFQIIFPIHSATFYFEGSIFNIVGLIFLILFLYLLYKQKEKQKALPFFLLYLSILFILYHKQTNIFYFDTYALTPLIFFLFSVAIIIQNIKKYKVLFFILPLLMSYQTYEHVRSRDSQEKFILNTYPKEPSCGSAEGYLLSLYYTGDFHKLKDFGEEWVNNNCFWINNSTYIKISYILAILIYINDDFTLNEKLKLYAEKKDPNLNVFTELIRLKLGEKDAGTHLLENFELLFKDNPLCIKMKKDFMVQEILKNCTHDISACDELHEFINHKKCQNE